VFTTETLEGVATPVTAPPLLPASLDDELPLQPAKAQVSTIKPRHNFTSADNLVLSFMRVLPVFY